MPAKRPNIVAISASSLNQGDYVTVKNLTRSSDRVEKAVDQNKKILIDLKDGISDYEVGDVLLIEVHGKQEGGKTWTVVEGGVVTTITTAASTAANISL